MESWTPLVSIVLPTYNGSRYICSSLDSCLQQVYPNLELIVVDGGSTDDTLELVQGYSDPRIRIVKQPANSGKLPGALNLGFSEARGELFTWTQDDDLYEPDAIQKMVAFLKNNPQVGLVYTGFWFIDEKGQVIKESEIHPPDAVHWTNPVGNCFLYRRETAEKTGEYSVDYLMAEDFHYWIRIYKCSQIALLPERHFYHRLHPGSLTVKKYGAFWALRVCARARKEVLGLSRSQYHKQVADSYIEEAFAAYAQHDYRHVLRSLAHGVARNPLWLGERGVLSIGLRSLLRKPPKLSPSRVGTG